MNQTSRVVLTLGLFALGLAAGALGLDLIPHGPVAHAAPAIAPLQQGVQATGMLTFGQGTCFPDAVLLDCAGNVSHQLKGPGGSGFFAPYIGQWVTLDGAEMTCVVGDKYIQVVNVQAVANPCGTGTPAPGSTATAVPPITETPTPIPATPGPSPTLPTGGSMSQGKTVWVSSEPDPAHPGVHAVDGDPNSFWASIADPYTVWDVRHVQWIYVDLGSAQQVRNMRMLWSDTARPRTYAIYAWSDRYEAWMGVANTRNGQVDDKPVFPYDVTGRYWMLWLETPYLAGSRYELKEWEINGNATAPIQSASVSAGKASLALSQEPGFEAGKASDANLASEWRSSAGLPSWLYTDFGSTYTIDRATLRWTAGMHATEYTLYAWDSAWSRWVAVYATTTGRGGDETVNFTAKSTRYLLVYATRGIGVNVGLREFEVYQQSSTGGLPPRPIAPVDSTWRFGDEPGAATDNASSDAEASIDLELPARLVPGDAGTSVPVPELDRAND